MSIVSKSLQLWGLDAAKVTFIAARENNVYRVDHTCGSFALRLHRQGHRTNAQLAAELDWMAWVAKSGISVPAPRASLNGSHLQIVDGMQIDVLSWLTGETLDAVLPGLGEGARKQIFRDLGQDLATLHIASDAWREAATCARPDWDEDGLLGDAPLWGRFWENPELSGEEFNLLCTFREKAKIALDATSKTLDYGLIHADLVPANVMVDQNRLHFIDFDDGGFGYRIFDIATALIKHIYAPDYSALRSCFLEGYSSRRELNFDAFDLFMALRASTYVGWNITRFDEDQSGNRNQRFIKASIDLASKYLGA